MSKFQREKSTTSEGLLKRIQTIAIISLAWLVLLSAPGYGDFLSDDLQIEGNRFFDAKVLLAQSGLKPNSPFNLMLLEAGIERMLRLYEDNGFPYCRISPGSFKVSEGGEVSFSFSVEEGPRVRVTEIRLEGLIRTKRDVIVREMGSGIIGLFSQSRLEAALEKVGRLSFIQQVEDIQLLAGDNPEEGILEISLRERRNNSLEGTAGYAPGVGSRKGNLFGSLDLVFDNIFGTGRKMRWNWSKRDPYSSHLWFSYREPWIFGLPPTLEIRLKQEDRDSTYLKLSASAEILFNSAEMLSWGLEGGWEKVIPGPAGEKQIPDSRKYTIGAVLILDLLDQPDNPQQGILYKTSVVLGRKRNYTAASFAPENELASSARLTLDLDHFLPTLRSQTCAVGIHMRELFTDEKLIPPSEQFELGGPESVRGFREGEILGTRVAWVNLEYRFILDQTSRFHLFVDYGHFARISGSAVGNSIENISGEKLGYGMGLRVGSKAGLLGVDYGLGQGDSFNQGKIHFRLINRF
jgi:outer membrane protein insertion porin family